MKRITEMLERQTPEFVVGALEKALPVAKIRRAVFDTQAESKNGSRRTRALPCVLTLWLIILLGFYRRTSYVNLMEKFSNTRWTSVFWKNGVPPTSSALTQARDRLGPEPLRELFHETAPELISSHGGLLFHGQRVFAIDGATCKTPDSDENRKFFGLPGASRGRAAYPQMRTTMLCCVGSHLIRNVAFGPYSEGEMTQARRLADSLEEGSLVLMDANFVAYDFLWDLHSQHKCNFVVRIPSNITPILVESNWPGDALVEVVIPRWYRRTRPDMPRRWRLRLIGYRPPGCDEPIRLLTDLLDAKRIPKEEIAGLYHCRWEQEMSFDELKTHQCDCATVNRPVLFRSKTPKRVEQEFYGMLLAYNAVRSVMATTAAEEAHLSSTRLSFTMTLERLREYLRDSTLIAPGTPELTYQRMVSAIARGVLPPRRDRRNPREVKVKMSKFRLKRSRAAA